LKNAPSLSKLFKGYKDLTKLRIKDWLLDLGHSSTQPFRGLISARNDANFLSLIQILSHYFWNHRTPSIDIQIINFKAWG
jgi:hypothetical protein